MTDRITAAIGRMKAQVAERIALGITTKSRVKATSKALDLDLAEHAHFQTLKTLAVANGKLTADEGQVVYRLLGGTPSVFNRRPVEVKYVLTSLYKELLGG